MFCAHDGKNVTNGINAWLLGLLPEFQKKGYDIRVLFTSWFPKDECTTITQLEDKGIPCIKVTGKRYSESEVKWILKFVKRENPDVVIVSHILPALFAGKWIIGANIPTVMILHNDDHEYDLLTQYFIQKQTPFTPTATVAVSKHIKQKLLSYRYNSLIKTIPYGSAIPEIKSSFNQTPFKILYAGRLVKQQKNIDNITEAFCRITAKLTNAEACIYGAGTDEKLVYDIINKLQCKHVHVGGLISNAELQKLLPSFQVIVLMSDYEGLPVALIEAMANGIVPVVKRINSGLPELVIEGETGLYANSIDEVVNKICYLHSNPTVWEQLSINAKHHIKTHYSREIALHKWTELFEQFRPVNKKSIQIPYRVKLPLPVLSQLGDNRMPPFIIRLLRRMKRTFAFD
ncbi:glycosyltransferase family 4 protein [Mucilaginibacter koreensis]